MRSLIYVVVLLFCVPIWGAPVDDKPAVYNHGDYVGVRAKHLNGEGKDSKNVNIHPAVVVGGPNAKNEYNVATISKNLPDNPPQTPLQNIHASANVYGNIQLGGSRTVNHDHMKPWKDTKTGGPHAAMPAKDLAKLHTEMAKHADWKPPPKPPVTPQTPVAPVRKNTLPGPSTARTPSPPSRKNTIHGPTNGRGPAHPAPVRKNTAPASSGSKPSALRSVPGRPVGNNLKSKPQRAKVTKSTKPRMVKAKKPAAKRVTKPAAKPVRHVAKPKAGPAAAHKVGRTAAAKPKVAKPVAARKVKRPAVTKPKVLPKPVQKAKAVAKAAPKRQAAPPRRAAAPKKAAPPKAQKRK